ncbi:hypothetical protein VFPPC_16434 [Pochonia chlamydosporia 170]|uniref:Uncharacterized protein n=1 Tax=Pochonia chlamydosporia 170 TaxID=1380566 RepID=A0A179FDM8_METCM|nr:hypothetical protein VFPPC_16434 [Pochonia chlamydosporia 170]OAQ63173.1 hypothetical protein VFPPC_16434 [Pochonia chlamydosporia 170]
MAITLPSKDYTRQACESKTVLCGVAILHKLMAKSREAKAIEIATTKMKN